MHENMLYRIIPEERQGALHLKQKGLFYEQAFDELLHDKISAPI